MLILTYTISKRELKPLSRSVTLEDVLHGARKVLKGLATEIPSPVKLQGYECYKVRVGKRTNARMIVFFVAQSGTVIPLLIRLKKDKILGMNMAPNNPRVITQLVKNIDVVLREIDQGDYQKFSLDA